MFAEYIGKFLIESIDFEVVNPGTLPPLVNGKFFLLRKEHVHDNEMPSYWD